MDNHDAVKVRDLHRETKTKKVVRPKLTTDFPGGVIREVASDLTLRAHEQSELRTFIDTSNVGNKRWEPPTVDANPPWQKRWKVWNRVREYHPLPSEW